MRSIVAALLVVACGGEAETVVFVTVRDRASMRAATALHIEVANEGATREEDFPVDGTFPVTFTITPAGRTGSLSIDATASGAEDVPVGVGRAQATIEPDGRVDVDLQLDPADFVVNSVVVGTQKLVFRGDFSGRQLAVHESGAFLVVWENDCPLDRCDILGRLFESDTQPRLNRVTQTTDEFVVNQLGEWTTGPSASAGTDGFLVAWVYRDDADTSYHIKATALDPSGTHQDTLDTTLTAGGQNEDAPTTLARQGGGYVVAWERLRVPPATGSEIVARRLDEAGGLDGPEILVAAETTLDLHNPHGAGLPGGGFVLVWTETDAGAVTRVRGRVFLSTGAPVGGGDVLVSQNASGRAGQPHVVVTPEGFVVGWQYGDTGRRLELRRFDASGAALGATVVLEDPTSDLYSSPSLAIQPGTAGRLGAAWHDCSAGGDGMGCGVHLAILDENLAPTSTILVNTTIPNNQDGPTLAGTDDGFLATFTDASGQPPDIDGSAIRARLLYPE